MPLPNPKKGEKEKDWIARCMGNDAMKEEFPDNDTRLAVCYTKWREKDKKSAEADDEREVRLCVNAELRVVDNEARAKGKGSELVGYAAKFNQVAEIWPGFREQIASGAFTQTLAEHDDVRMLFNHNPDIVLGRTKADTLRLEEDDTGLRIHNWPPKTTAAADLLINVREGNVTQMSFAFRVREQTVVDNDDGSMDRTITNAQLHDVSVATFPVYEDAEVDIRCQDTTVVAKMMKDWADKTDVTKPAKTEKPDVKDKVKSAKDDPGSLRRSAHVRELREQLDAERE